MIIDTCQHFRMTFDYTVSHFIIAEPGFFLVDCVFLVCHSTRKKIPGTEEQFGRISSYKIRSGLVGQPSHIN